MTEREDKIKINKIKIKDKINN